MRTLLLGSGGREHALAFKFTQSNLSEKVYVLPGNDGMKLTPQIELINGGLKDFDFILQTIKDKKIDFVVVGPEEPLSNGIVDFLEENNVLVYGPSKAAAQLEGSKIFSKEFMNEFSIPTAKAQKYYSYEEALKGLSDWDFKKGIALKADSLAAGKGVVVTHDEEEAKKVLFDFMVNPECSVKTKNILIEEKLVGKEVSAFALCDGERFVSLGLACDHKRVGDGDTGPNTGGMGCFRPMGWPSEKVKKDIDELVFRPVIEGMKKRKTPYKGILFAGLMVDGDELSVIEYNVRFGDPETQTLVPLIESDLLELFYKAAKGALNDCPPIKLKSDCSVHVVMVSGGYPALDQTPMELNHVIQFDKEIIPHENSNNEFLFMAGVKNKDGNLVNTGGRVLGVTALGKNKEEARKKAYDQISKINFNKAHWRTDIGI